MELSGFNSLDPAKLVVVKKIIGNYAKKINDNKGQFQKLSLDLVSNDSDKLQMSGKLDMNGNSYSSMVEDTNLFVVLDKVLKQLQQELQ